MTNQLQALPDWLRKEGAFESEIEMPVPSDLDKTQILRFYLDQIELPNAQETSQKIAQKLHGFVAGDITTLVKRAYSKCPNLEKFDQVLESQICQISPSALKARVYFRKTIGAYYHNSQISPKLAIQSYF